MSKNSKVLTSNNDAIDKMIQEVSEKYWNGKSKTNTKKRKMNTKN